jgi:predicted secreted hydrolase
VHRRKWIALGLVAVLFLSTSFRYQRALDRREFLFPNDHSAHPDYRTEWWYYTGHLETESGKRYGYQVTFFRIGLRDYQETGAATLFTDLYMAHFVLSDKDAETFIFRERVNRGYEGKAGANVGHYRVWNEDWRVVLEGKTHVITVKDGKHSLQLRLTPTKPPVLHGDNGLSRKGQGAGRASYYYSLTRIKTEGVVQINRRAEKVQGLSWMDHEFGSDQLGKDQIGWDWFSLQLNNETELMLYLMRRRDGTVDPVSSGTLVYKDGTTRKLSLDAYNIRVLEQWTSPQSRATYPMGWKVRIPTEKLELEVLPFFAQQEINARKSTRVTYWEGSVRIRGTMGDGEVRGLGYVELTGYAEGLRF